MNLSHLVLDLFITFHKTLFAFVLFSGRGRGVIRSGISRVFPATMQKAAEVLDNFGVAYEKKVVSAHRTPDLMFKHAEEARSRGIKVIIAGAGGAAHLPGMVAAKTTLPVIGVPVKSRALSGVDSLYSIVQMPGGVPVATMAIGEAGATNAALFALRLLSVEDKAIADALANFAEEQGKIAEESTNELN